MSAEGTGMMEIDKGQRGNAHFIAVFVWAALCAGNDEVTGDYLNLIRDDPVLRSHFIAHVAMTPGDFEKMLSALIERGLLTSQEKGEFLADASSESGASTGF